MRLLFQEVISTPYIVFTKAKACDWLFTRIRKEITSQNTKENSQHAWVMRILKVLCEFRITWSSWLPKAISSSFQLQIVHGLKRVRFLTSRALKWYIVCKQWTSESAPKVQKKDAAAVLWFPLLHCSFLAYFERLWQRVMELQILVLHEFELPKALPWIPKNSPQSWIALVIKKLSKHQNLTQFD